MTTVLYVLDYILGFLNLIIIFRNFNRDIQSWYKNIFKLFTLFLNNNHLGDSGIDLLINIIGITPRIPNAS